MENDTADTAYVDYVMVTCHSSRKAVYFKTRYRLPSYAKLAYDTLTIYNTGYEPGLH